MKFGEGEGKVPLDKIGECAKKYQPKSKITYKMIQEYVEKKYGFKVHTAYIVEVKRSLGLTMHDVPNAVEDLKQPRKYPPDEKVEAIKEALKYFEVIKWMKEYFRLRSRLSNLIKKLMKFIHH